MTTASIAFSLLQHRHLPYLTGRRSPAQVCNWMWPGNTVDVTTLLAVIERLKTRFLIARIGVVADRGMISAATLADSTPATSAISSA